MSSYQAKRGPNVSQFLASLNAMRSAEQQQQQQQQQPEGFGIDDTDLDLFMNTEFLEDFDSSLGPGLDQSPIPIDPSLAPHHGGTSDATPTAQNTATANPSVALAGGGGDVKNMPFEDDFPFHGLPYITTNNAPQLQGAPMQNYTSPTQDFDLTFGQPTSPYGAPPTPKSTTVSPPNGKQVPANDAAALEANSRAAAEEDKRRRNTAASARFRVKKKQREQALEKTAKEMTDKCEQLEKQVAQLEMENKWLRGLVVEKTTKSVEEVAELWKKFKEDDRSNPSEKKGVGTTEA